MKRIGTIRIMVFFLAVMACMTLAARQAKRVYITLDVSGSMTGNKYALANYTAQMIVTLCDEDDEVYIIVYGKDKCLSKEKQPLKIIQVPMEKIRFGIVLNPESQIDDIRGFNSVYKPSKKHQDWLFIIGDGYWDTQNNKNITKKFQSIVSEGSLNVCYLQTSQNLSEHSDFTSFVETLGVVDIGKSSIEVETIKKGCNHFAKKILGFSEVPLKVNKSAPQCISVKAELPLKEFFLVYQDKVTPGKLPKIEGATSDGKPLEVKLKGTPSTEPLKTKRKEVDLSGHVYHIKGNSIIPTNTEIEVCFDKDINPDNVIIYPLVENVEFGALSLTQAGGKLKKLDSRTSSICREESKATVRIELNPESAKSLPEALLKKTKVVVKANNKDYETEYKNGGFECDIDIVDEETQYYAECDCPGYFKRVTPIAKIVKGDCDPPAEMEIKEMPVSELRSMTFEELKNNDIRIRIQDEQTKEALNPNLFDITFDIENDFLYEEPEIHFENDTIVLKVRPKGEWCECLFPESLNIKMKSTPKDGAFEQSGKQYRQTVFPIHLEVIKDRPWIIRCLWVVILLIVLLLLIVYLRALLKKNRFKKSARIKNTYMEMKGSLIKETELQSGIRLRQKGFVPWVNRWLVPFRDEYRSINWQTPSAGATTFVAAKSKETVNLTRESFKPHKMKMGDYDPQNTDQPQKKLIMMDDAIKIYQERKYQGKLEYYSGGADDEKYYRITIHILIFLSAAIATILTIMMVRAFF